MNETTQPPKKKNSLLMQSAWLLCAKTIGFILSFILPMLVVRYLTKDKVGVYKQVFLVVANAVSILPLGFSMSAYYFLNREPERRKFTISNILLFNFFTGGAACITLFLFPQLLGNLFQNDEITRLAPRIGVVVWLWIFSAFLETVALANQEVKLATAFIILSQFTRTLLLTGALLLFSSIESLVYAATAQGVLQVCVLLVYLNSRFPRFWTQFDFRFFREQIIYALPFGLAGLLYTLQSDVHNYFVSNRFGEEQFAVYSQGCFELPLIAILYESFSGVMIPRMSELQAAGKRREMLLTSVGAMQKLAFAYFPVFIFLMIVADVFITTLFTNNFAESIPIFRINLILLPFYCLMIDPIGRAFAEVGRFLLKMRVILFIALLAALYFGVRHFDLRGVIAIVVVVVIIEILVSFLKVASILQIKRADVYLLETVGKTAFAALASGVFLFLFYWLAKDFLLAACINFSRSILTLIEFQKGSDFFGGSLFLGICLALYASIYLFFANLFGAFRTEDKDKLKATIANRFAFTRKFLNRKTLLTTDR